MPTFKSKLSFQYGFSLIELLVVISIFAVITAGLIPFSLRQAAERQLIVAVEEVYSAIQLQQSNAAQGVNGSWYGAEFDSQNKKVILYEVQNPNECPITTNSLVLSTSHCTVLQREFFSNAINENGFETQLTYGTNPPEENIIQKVEARFNRGPYGQEVILYRDTSLQSSNLQRMRLAFELGDVKRILVIDGGNICNAQVLSHVPPQCITPGGLIGGSKIGRIFVVESTL